MAKRYIFPDKFLGRGLLFGLICFPFILGQNGCGITAASKPPHSLKGPVPPLVGEAATRFYQQARNKCENAPPVEGDRDGVSELVLTCVSTGRDFYEPKGPDGFVLKVTPLDKHYRTVQTAANITIILYGGQGAQVKRGRNTSGPSAERYHPKHRKVLLSRPLRLWYVPANELADYWMPSRLLNGFLFRLEWAREVPPGDYILSVIYERQERSGTQTICQEVFFQDQSPRR
jgi:hypothetical protein